MKACNTFKKSAHLRGRVVFVDDEPGICRMIADLLRDSYEIETFLDATSAWDSINRRLPDLIIADIRMPGRSGFDLLKATRAHALTRLIPFILLTGNHDEASCAQGFELGAVDYITKPFSPRELVSRVAAHFHSAREALHQAEELVAQRTAELSNSNEQLTREIMERKRLEREILNITERERRSIGWDLHDGICQILSGLQLKHMILTQSITKIAPDKLSECNVINQILAETTIEARRIARGLYPVMIESLGLTAALRELAMESQKLFSIQIFCDFHEPAPAVELNVANQIYRIAQEAISNAIKHGAAKHIWMEFGPSAEQIVLSIRNDGRPFPEDAHSSPGMGLRIMASRADLLNASLTIKSAPNSGTILTCRFFANPSSETRQDQHKHKRLAPKETTGAR
jgi:signal transduction histidine kinase